jgi:hypothetical protein
MQIPQKRLVLGWDYPGPANPVLLEWSEFDDLGDDNENAAQDQQDDEQRPIPLDPLFMPP